VQYPERRGKLINKSEVVETALRHQPRRAPPQRTYYHVTEEKYVPSIMREGLNPESTPQFGRHLPAVFLSASLEGTLTVAEWYGLQRPYLLKIQLPSNRAVYIDEVGLETCPEAEAVYVVGSIQPKYIKPVRSMVTWE